MRGVGVVFSRYLEVDINSGVFIGMGIVLFYAILGGVWDNLYSSRSILCINFCFHGSRYFISIEMTNNPIPQLGFGSVGSDGA